ncbi:hypothetical protein EMCRGX_G025032 [Ephydatia muelleri]
MVAVTFLLVSCLVAVCIAQPARPNPPETFFADVFVEIHDSDHPVFGRGFFAQDATLGHRVESGTFEDNTTLTGIALYDKGFEYIYRSAPGSSPSCQVRALNGTIPKYWGWVASATYEGTRPDPYIHTTLNIWRYRPGAGFEFELGVGQTTPNVPVLSNLYQTSTDTLTYFNQFFAVTPNAGNFTVPSICLQ